MLGSHHHLQRESLAPRPVELFSISSQDQNPSRTRQGLSAAPPRTASLSKQDYRLPGGGRSASSLRTSRRMTAEGSMNKRTSFSVKDRCVIRSLYSHATLPRVSHSFRTGRRRSRCTDWPMNNRDHLPPESPPNNIFEQGQRLNTRHLLCGSRAWIKRSIAPL